MLKKYLADLRREFAGYNGKMFGQDVMAGLTVAAVALPLALAFGVSSGADAAAGLVTAIMAGVLIGAFSGASYQISGPTGAMAAILISLSVKYGIEGVLMAGVLSGIILILCAVLKLGKLVSFIPAPVITGFTSGIAIVIAKGQIDNFFGMTDETIGFAPDLQTTLFSLLVVAIMVVYPKKLNAIIPSSLAAIIVALIVNMIINPVAATSTVAEVGEIPKSLMTENALFLTGLNFEHIDALLMSAISIAALGMIESLLCGASAGKMKGEKFDADRELIAQGVGNIIIPFFGGVPATAAIARTSVAIKSGGQTRVVSLVHSGVLILSMFLLGGVMSRIPMAALAGVLMVVAFRMNEWVAIKQIFNKRLKAAILKFTITMIATVVFDLTVAILIGVLVAMALFIIQSSDLEVVVRSVDVDKLEGQGIHGSYNETNLIYLTGPLFFGTQDRVSAAMQDLEGTKNIIISMRGVPSIDDSAVEEFKDIYEEYSEKGSRFFFCGVQPHVKEKMDKYGFTDIVGEDVFFWDAIAAMKHLEIEGENK